MEITPSGGAVLSREESSSVESSSSEVSKELAGRKVLEKTSSFQASESSKVVEASSRSISSSSSSVISSSVSSVSSSVSSQRQVSSVTSGLESTQVKRIEF